MENGLKNKNAFIKSIKLIKNLTNTDKQNVEILQKLQDRLIKEPELSLDEYIKKTSTPSAVKTEENETRVVNKTLNEESPIDFIINTFRSMSLKLNNKELGTEIVGSIRENIIQHLTGESYLDIKEINAFIAQMQLSKSEINELETLNREIVDRLKKIDPNNKQALIERLIGSYEKFDLNASSSKIMNNNCFADEFVSNIMKKFDILKNKLQNDQVGIQILAMFLNSSIEYLGGVKVTLNIENIEPIINFSSYEENVKNDILKHIKETCNLLKNEKLDKVKLSTPLQVWIDENINHFKHEKMELVNVHLNDISQNESDDNIDKLFFYLNQIKPLLIKDS